MENTTPNLYTKLQDARVTLAKMNIKKTGYNSFSKFSYFELSDFLPHIDDIFKQQKLTSIFNICDEFAELMIINSEEPTERETFRIPRPKVGVDMKGQNELQRIGAENTYLKRYLYLNVMDIIEADSVDADTIPAQANNTGKG